MTAGPANTIWEADAHTAAKIAILEAYLVAYFQILGKTMERHNLLYIDGFAGPNRYSNREYGSPSAAINGANDAMSQLAGQWKSGQVHFAFVEKAKDRFQCLKETLTPSLQNPRLVVHTYNSEFVKALPLIKRAVPEPFRSGSPLFAFLDPFGVTGAPFETVADILASDRSELLLNLDADGIDRVFAAGHESQLTEAFGNEAWKDVLSSQPASRIRYDKILQLYKERLRTIPGVEYLYQVEMQGKSGKLNYFLVFASKHPLGLKRMKEAMKRISQNRSYVFSDASIGQTVLFQADDCEDHYLRLLDQFKGQTVSYDGLDFSDDISAFALNETPLFDAKCMLRRLEDRNLISVVEQDKDRRRGSFNEKVKSVFFGGTQGELF